MFKRKKKKISGKVVQCRFRYMTELTGFEDEFRPACACKKHPDATEYFVECCAEKCPKDKYS